MTFDGASLDPVRPVRIVFLDRATLPATVRLRPAAFSHEISEYEQTAPGEVAARIVDADVVVTNKVRLESEHIESAAALKHIAVAATGTDIVALDACRRRSITVSNIRGYAVATVPEHTFALILALRRSMLAYADSVRAGRWQESGQFCYFDHPIGDLAGATLGIVGDGVLGRAVADLGRAFGMQVLFSAYKGVSGMGPLYTPFEEVLRRSDVITLHSPLTPTTRHMISGPEFALMERRPIIVNTARGGLVDEEALHDALTAGQIAGAGFDVVTEEPPPTDHPLMRLVGRPDFILTPHVAWASTEATQTLADQLMDNIDAHLRGEPRNLVG